MNPSDLELDVDAEDVERLWTCIPRKIDDSGTKAENPLIPIVRTAKTHYSSSRLNNQSNYGPDDSDKKGGLDENKNAVGSFESSVSNGGGKWEWRRIMRVDGMLARAGNEKTEEVCVRIWPTFFFLLFEGDKASSELGQPKWSDWWR